MGLEKLTDNQLIENIKKLNDSDSFVELKSRHERLFYRTCYSYCGKISNLKYEEMIQNCDYIINKSVQSFKPDKSSKFSSWLCNQSRYFCLNTIKAVKNLNMFQTCENKDIDYLNNINNIHYNNEVSEFSEYVSDLINKLKDERGKKIIELRYFGNKKERKWKYIANKINLSVQQSVNIFKASKKFLLKEIKKEKTKI